MWTHELGVVLSTQSPVLELVSIAPWHHSWYMFLGYEDELLMLVAVVVKRFKSVIHLPIKVDGNFGFFYKVCYIFSVFTFNPSSNMTFPYLFSSPFLFSLLLSLSIPLFLPPCLPRLTPSLVLLPPSSHSLPRLTPSLAELWFSVLLTDRLYSTEEQLWHRPVQRLHGTGWSEWLHEDWLVEPATACALLADRQLQHDQRHWLVCLHALRLVCLHALWLVCLHALWLVCLHDLQLVCLHALW